MTDETKHQIETALDNLAERTKQAADQLAWDRFFAAAMCGYIEGVAAERADAMMAERERRRSK